MKRCRLSVVFYGLLTTMLAVSLGVAEQSATVSADGGLSITSATTYTIDPDSAVVHVAVEMSLRNTSPDQVSGGVTNRRYFLAVSLPVPVDATNPKATTINGVELETAAVTVPDNANYFLYRIALDSNLYYGQTAQLTVFYDITGQPPRSENASRVNEAYASFRAFGVGDAGKVTVRVVVPAGFTSDTFGSDAVTSTEGDTTVYTASDIANPDEFGFFVSARNDDRLVDSEITTADGAEFRLRAWPGDLAWQQFMADQIAVGIPELSRLIGQPWPILEQVEVREAFTPYLYGYGGWFNAQDNELEIGEDLDPITVLHELSHAWFNGRWFSERWLSEGFAQLYAARAEKSLGGEPSEAHTIEVDEPGQISLSEWGPPLLTPGSDGADEVEDYAYNASFAVVSAIADEVSDDDMQRILKAVADGTIAYQGDVEPEQVGSATDWRRFLDLVEELGGAQEAEQIMAQYVLSDDQLKPLQPRAATRSDYQHLLEVGGQWAAPLAVRSPMASWDFDDAEQLIKASLAVLAQRDELANRAQGLGIDYPATLETLYERADTQLDDVASAMQEQISTADTLLAAVSAVTKSRGTLETIGLIGVDLSATVEEAKLAFSAGDADRAQTLAQQVLDRAAGARGTGEHRVLIASGVAVSFTLIVWVSWSIRRRKRGAAVRSDVSSEGDHSTGPTQI